MGNENEPIPSQLQPGSSHDGHLQTSQVAPLFHHGASSSQPDQTISFSELDHSYQTPQNDILANGGTKSSAMEYTRPLEHAQQQRRIDYNVPFGDSSVPVHCPVCGQMTVSKTKHVSGGYTYGWALGICAVTCLGCIPFCVGRLKNVEHRCGNCDQKLATWHRYQGRVDIHAWS